LHEVKKLGDGSIILELFAALHLAFLLAGVSAIKVPSTAFSIFTFIFFGGGGFSMVMPTSFARPSASRRVVQCVVAARRV
jgi:hypothetical protein